MQEVVGVTMGIAQHFHKTVAGSGLVNFYGAKPLLVQ